jgi:hypothetical protein
MNPAFAFRSALIPAQPSIRCGIPVEVVQRDRLSDDFVAGWNAAANHFQTPPAPALPRPTEVIFHGPATIVYWNDGTKTVVKCQPGDTFSAETGLMAAMLKRYMGNDNTYNKVLNYWLDKLVPQLPQLPAAAE